jgi:multiple sugar transport system ATP-binding protein
MAASDLGINVNHLRKSFRGGSVLACEDVNLSIEEGELLVMLGPSGCGKTTTLRCIAGLEHPDNDDAIWIRGANMTRVPPRNRNLAFVFQETATFPNLSVRKNISFGLDMRKQTDKAETERRVEQASRMLKIDHLLDRRPHELSGGQGQRVALGRAIVCEPAAFLLDEPLAALDAALRVEMRTEIKLIQRRIGSTMIFVTHDQEEALTIGDKIAVMSEGRVQQVDTPHNVYNRPANLFVATFIGLPPINRFEVRLQGRNGDAVLVAPSFTLPLPGDIAARIQGTGDSRLTLGIRPEFMRIGPDGPLPGTVKLVEMMGSRTLVLVEHEGTDLRVLVQGEPGLVEGEKVGLSPMLERAFIFDGQGRNLLA